MLPGCISGRQVQSHTAAECRHWEVHSTGQGSNVPVCMHISLCACACACVGVHMCACVCVPVVCMCVDTFVCMLVYPCVHVHVCVCVCVCVHVCEPPQQHDSYGVRPTLSHPKCRQPPGANAQPNAQTDNLLGPRTAPSGPVLHLQSWVVIP